MSQEIINRVANSKLETIDLEHFFPKIERVSFDIKPWLKDELFLLEKDFREKVKNFDWRKYKNKAVYIICSNDAIVPDWAYILISSQLNTFNVRNVIGSKEVLNVKLITEIVDAFDFSIFKFLFFNCSNACKDVSSFLKSIFLISELLSDSFNPKIESSGFPSLLNTETSHI